MVGQVPPVLWGRHFAPAVVDFLFLGQRVVNAGEQFNMFVKFRRQRPRACFTQAAVRVGHQVQRGLKAQGLILPCHGEHQPGHGFIEQPVPRGGPDSRLIVQELFQLVRQLVRAHGAHAVEHRLVAGKRGIRRQQSCKVVFFQAVEFETEKHQRRGKFGDLVLRISHEFGAVAVQRVLVIAQARKRHDAACHDVDLLIRQDTIQHGGGIQR